MLQSFDPDGGLVDEGFVEDPRCEPCNCCLQRLVEKCRMPWLRRSTRCILRLHWQLPLCLHQVIPSDTKCAKGRAGTPSYVSGVEQIQQPVLKEAGSSQQFFVRE
ncbi:unnamed protein product [Symbiodinium sp. CCMP2592]|nr:unnamed protein product [Symbiodinium sp. CCMP2592]